MKWPAALLVFVALFAVYQANLTVLLEGDTTATETLPLALLRSGRPSFDPMAFPELFLWRSNPPFMPSDEFSVNRWSERFGDRTARQWWEAKRLELAGPRYFLVESELRKVYVSVFGPIPGLVALPAMAVAYALNHGASLEPAQRVSVGKLVASALAAATAVMIFLVTDRRLGRRPAYLLAAVYGLGTCAWSVSSQNAWQQTVTQALLAAGAYFVLVNGERRARLALAGFLLGAAAACRPTAGFALVAVLASVAPRDRKGALALAIGALPVPLFALSYNAHYFGSPFTFAQELVGHRIAQQKTGSPGLFQTPFLTGAAGLLFSPARGLAVYSPVLLPAAWALVRAFRDPGFRALRPFGVAAAAMMAVQCKWFDWWGGHTYGYRPWLDAVPYLVLLLLPVVPDFTASARRRLLFGAAFAWSVCVQAVGAFAYDRSWNHRDLYLVDVPGRARPEVLFGRVAAERFAAEANGAYVGHLRCDVDLPACRHRLWSLRDSPLVYYVTHFSRTRAARWSFVLSGGSGRR